jgi:hypothetical protein
MPGRTRDEPQPMIEWIRFVRRLAEAGYGLSDVLVVRTDVGHVQLQVDHPKMTVGARGTLPEVGEWLFPFVVGSTLVVAVRVTNPLVLLDSIKLFVERQTGAALDLRVEAFAKA